MSLVKKCFQHIASFLMAVILLFSTMSFTVSKHYCGTHLVDKAVFSKAKTCGMEMPTSQSQMKNNCCSDKQIAVKGQNELKQNFHQLDFDQQLFLASFAYSYLNLFEPEAEQPVPFQFYSPPELVTDIQVVDQVFLI